MATTFVIQNENGHYWSKQKSWTDGRDRRLVFRCPDKVDAINLVFELSSKDTTLRAQYLECDMDDFGNPQVEASSIPLPIEEDREELEKAGEEPHIQSEQG